MPAPRSRRRARLAVLVSAALAVTGFQFLVAAPAAQAASTGLVIAEFYGNGGNSGAVRNADFVELWNPTASPISLTGKSLQYRSATGTSTPTGNQALSGTVAAGGRFLIQISAATANGTALPTPDFTTASPLNAGGTNGTFWLANTTAGVNLGAGGSIINNSNVIDLIGFGTSNTFETAAATGVSDNTKSFTRTNLTTDGDNNSTDFTAGAPTPQNAAGQTEATTPLALAAITDKTGTVGQAITGFSFVGSGGTGTLTYSATGLPGGISVNPSTGAVSGTPTTACTCSVTAKVTDGASTEATRTFAFTVTEFSVTNPGDKSYVKNEAITPFSIQATGGSGNYSYAVTGPNPLPAGLTLDAGTGQISGTPTAAQAATATTVTVTDTTTSSTASTTFNISVADVLAIADVQGTGARSPFAPANNATSSTPANGQTVTTQGVVTAVYTKGFASSGAANCGFCGFYLQTGGPDGTPGASDGIFVFTSGFTGLDSANTPIAIGQSLRVTGTVSEFSSATDPATESVTEITATKANTNPVAALPAVVPQTTLPATYADREAHEGELYTPNDLVITDTFNFESFGELGLAQGKPLVQPTEECADDDSACITAKQAVIKNKGWFVEDGTSTTFSSGAAFFRPKNSNNSDIPFPYIDKTHSARVGAEVHYPLGGVLDFRNKKWYVQVPRAVISTHNGTPDMGTDVLTIEDTRPANAAPAPVGGDLKIATYNVENYFSITGKAFETANPYYGTSGPGCEYDYDRADNPILTFQCTSPQGIPTAFDPVTNAPTAYGPGLVNAPRGAGTQESLDRQTAKIVTAINGLGADVVSLEELGNPNKLRMGVTNAPLSPDPDKADGGLGTAIAWRDASISYLVDALNDAAGAGTWSFVASPEESTDATSVNHMCSTKNADGTDILPVATAGTCSWASGQDVIRSGFLYKKATVVPVGTSDLDLPGSSAPIPSPFDNAREPLAQFFKPVGHPNADGFAVIVNHFKSKGNSSPAATGDNANDPLVGAFNGDRTRQATELLRFAKEFAAKWNTTKVFLVGDFNAYTHEDPVQTILNDSGPGSLGFDVVTSDDPDDLTYVFTTTVDGVGYGGAGSLDHVLASTDARAMITGTDVWEINSNEPGAYNYSRYDNNKTDFWDATVPFAGSDHNPEIIGINVGGSASVRDIQIIGSNDFHGRLVGSSSDGGAAQLAGAVKSLKATYGDANSTFVAAGDLIGASTFESFIDKDKPTLKALNAAGLEVSAVGNHEFDQGYHDLIDRVMKPYDATTNPDGIPGGINWQYIGSNVVYDGDPDGAGPKQDGDTIVMPTYMKDFGGGIKVGFVGAVTEDLPGLVSPAGLAGVEVTPIAAAVNSYATQLKADGADLVILLVHEGAPSTNCATMNSDGSSFDTLLGQISPDIDAVISGHTHLEYSCSFPVAEWQPDSNHPIKTRPVVSAGQYGVALDQIVYSFDTGTGKPVAVTSNNVGVKGPGGALFSYPEDSAVKQIVDDAVAAAQGPGAVVLGKISGPFKRARLAGGVTENRGGESTLGNLVAEIQRWATPTSTGIAPAQIAFMNPGGLRDDMNGAGATFPKDVTYKAAAAVQPFANTLVNMDMTGAQIKAVLEQQWQRDASGNVPSRPFLRLGTSKGFTYTYTESIDPAHSPAKLGHVTGMWLDGVPIADATTYSVTMNSFLASGGDNFTAFTTGADKRDTGKSDLQAQVEYMAAKAQPAPLAVDYAQHAVKVTFPNGAPASYAPGDAVSFDVASLAMTGVGDAQDSSVKVMLNGNQLGGTFPVDNTAGSNPDDTAGAASVTVNLPGSLPGGTAKLHLVGTATGTDIIVPIQVSEATTHDIQILATNDFHGRIANDPTTAAAGAGAMAQAVKQFRTADPDTVFAAAGDLIGASTFESFIDKDKPTIDALNSAGLEVSSVGNHEFDQGYDDLVNRVMAPASGSNPKGGAGWQYLGANVRFKANNNPALPATWTKDFGSVRVGFVGAVTEHLPELVSPGGIADIKVTDIVNEVNAAATDLKTTQGADLVIMLVHEGAAGTNCATMDDDPTSDFGKIITGVNQDVDAIVSGHTHLEYDCTFPVSAWAGRPVTERPVVSAGQYGANLNKLNFTVDTATGQVQAVTHSVVHLKTCSAGGTACGGSGQPAWTNNYTQDAPTQAIVDAAVANADVLGAVELGKIGGPFSRGKTQTAGQDNRGAESTVGNLVAEVQRWATSTPTSGSAQIAFMNPGGLRADMVGTGTGAFPRTLTYKQAATVQPFANTLVNMDLTGAQIKSALEQQWQPGGASRPFLRLGISKGFTYTYDPGAAAGSRIKQMWLNGTPIDPAATYSVTVNSFLATGGDNFTAFAGGTGKQDTGKTDLQGMVDYMAEFANTSQGDAPLPVDATQRSVGVTFPVGAPASYDAGGHVLFNVSSWSMTGPGDVTDSQVVVKAGATTLGTFTLDNALQVTLPGFDEVGKASVDVVVPDDVPAGPLTLTLTGATTGTSSQVTIQVGKASSTTTAPDVNVAYGDAVPVNVTVTGPGATPTGSVELFDGATSLGTATLGADGKATITVPAASAFPVGSTSLSVTYSGDATHLGSSTTLTVTTTKATSSVSAPDVSVAYGAAVPVAVTVTGAGATPTGSVELFDGATSLGTATLGADGKATITVPAASAFPVGSTSLSVTYSGDASHLGSNTTLTVTTTKGTADASAPDVSVEFGQPVPVQVTVTGAGATPSGTVQLLDGALPLGTPVALGADGKATITVPAKTFPVGSKSLTISYSGDASYQSDTGSVTATTTKATSSTNAPDVNTIAGSGGTVTVSVTAANVVPTGTVTLKNGASVVASASLLGGQASFNLPVLPDGTTLTAEYAGDSSVKPSSDTFTIHVGKATPIVSADDVSGVYGSPVTVTVHVGGPAGVNPSGTVTIRNGGASLGTGAVSGGVATIVIAGGVLPAGDTALTAEYGGDANLGAGTDAFTAHVSKAASTTDGKVSPKHPKAGHKVKLTVTVDGANGVEATGQVKVKVGGKTLTATLENGKAKINIGSFAKGKRHVTVTYLGSATLEGSSTKVKFTVT